MKDNFVMVTGKVKGNTLGLTKVIIKVSGLLIK